MEYHDKSLECDDPDCECHDWRSEVEEQLFAQHQDAPEQCPDGCPWCLADGEARTQRNVFDFIFGRWRR